MTVDLKQQSIELIKSLCDKNILSESNFDNLENQTFHDIVFDIKECVSKNIS